MYHKVVNAERVVKINMSETIKHMETHIDDILRACRETSEFASTNEPTPISI